jgi:HK97 family phage prohead protease
MLLRKSLLLSDVNLKMEGDTGKFSGYASVFGGVDAHGDTILKGAFDSTLRANGKPKMFLEHAWAFSSGAAALPIGKYTVAKEDDHGLYVEGELTPGMSLANDVHAAMKHGTLDGLSIGGLIKKGDYDETDSGRVIRRWTKLIEVSPVVFPADGAARIDSASVKSADILEAIEDLHTIRDFESFLRDAGGLSKGAATALTARMKSLMTQGDPAQDDIDKVQLAAILTKATAISLR